MVSNDIHARVDVEAILQHDLERTGSVVYKR